MPIQSKNVLTPDGKQYHIRCKTGEVGRYVLLPGDPFRTDIIARRLENARLIAHNREHKTWTGTLDGVDVSVCSTGMGCPSAAIALEELIHCGADTFIRIGTCGYVSDEARETSPEGIIVTASVRDEGTTIHYVPVEYPAIADRNIVAALTNAAARKKLNYLEGIAQSKDSFYGQHDPDGMPAAARLKERWEAWKRSGVLASEMETAALFVICSIRGCRAGAILSYADKNSIETSIDTAVDALMDIIKTDKNQDI
ncbi:uridine phosphorylase [Spirochaetia bacterium]|nr:uridine phosphorylase [Spirochaetia bacterium]